MYAENFVGRINKLYSESGLSVKDFADKVGISRQTMDFYLNGKRSPSAESLIKISNAFSVSTDWLLAITDVRSQSVEIQSAVAALGISEAAAILIKEQDEMGKESINYLLEFDAHNGMSFINAWRDYIIALTNVPYNKVRDNKNDTENNGIEQYLEDGRIVLSNKATAEYYSAIAEKYFTRLCNDIYDRIDFYFQKTKTDELQSNRQRKSKIDI